MTNPLDDLAANPTLPAPPRQHSSGRRELRAARLANGITLRVRPATVEDQIKMSRGEFVTSLPIRRAAPKMSKKARKRREREQS